MLATITPGAVYWIHAPTHRFRVRVIDRAYSVAGWWVCELVDSRGGRILPGEWFVAEDHQCGRAMSIDSPG